MSKSKKQLLKEINDVLNNYKSRELRMGLRTNTDSEYRKFAGYQYEGPVLNVRYLEDELHITILDRSNTLFKEDKEITVKLLAYNKSTFDFDQEYELQDIEYYERKNFQGNILEIKVGQNGKTTNHLFIRN